MSLDLLATKFYVPAVRPEFVDRPRLITMLNTGLTRKLILISAPAGFGKTILVADWLRHLKERTAGQKDQSSKPAWLSLDEEDNDPVRFVMYVIAALQAVLPEVGVDAQALLQSPQPPPLKSALTIPRTPGVRSTFGSKLAPASGTIFVSLPSQITTILGSTRSNLKGVVQPFSYSLAGVVVWFGLIIMLSAVASFWPARNASRLTVREVLAYE